MRNKIKWTEGNVWRLVGVITYTDFKTARDFTLNNPHLCQQENDESKKIWDCITMQESLLRDRKSVFGRYINRFNKEKTHA